MKICIYPLLLASLLILSCQPSPRPIEFGEEECHFCKMTIMDRSHAAQVVTDKGRVYSFDAIECMAQYVAENEDQSYSHLLVMDYLDAGTKIDARSSYYLISKSIPSPMGAFLSAFRTREAADRIQAEKGGVVLDWSEMKAHITGGGQ